MTKLFYVVFNNDAPLFVYESEDAANARVADLRKKSTDERDYFHWHDVPEGGQ